MHVTYVYIHIHTNIDIIHAYVRMHAGCQADAVKTMMRERKGGKRRTRVEEYDHTYMHICILYTRIQTCMLYMYTYTCMQDAKQTQAK